VNHGIRLLVAKHVAYAIPTVLLSLARQSNAKTCASMVIECGRKAEIWSGAHSVSRLLRGFEVRATSTQRRKQCSPVFTARAI
jgi:hypothetical protein